MSATIAIERMTCESFSCGDKRLVNSHFNGDIGSAGGTFDLNSCGCCWRKRVCGFVAGCVSRVSWQCLSVRGVTGRPAHVFVCQLAMHMAKRWKDNFKTIGFFSIHCQGDTGVGWRFASWICRQQSDRRTC